MLDVNEYSEFEPYIGKSANFVQIGQHHIVDASSEEEVCSLARYIALYHICQSDTVTSFLLHRL